MNLFLPPVAASPSRASFPVLSWFRAQVMMPGRRLMFSIVLSAVASWVLGTGTGRLSAEPITLSDYGLRIDGVTSFPTRGEALPAAANTGTFDRAAGVGMLTIAVRSPGPHSVSLFLDHEIDYATNTFFNEFAARVGTPAPGQSWEIDEPGYQTGNLFTNFLAGRLDNSNAVSSAVRDDVAMALGWNFTLGPNQTALVRMTVSETNPPTGFYLAQTDPQSQKTIYFWSTLETAYGDTEPPTITCPENVIAQVDPGTCARSNVTFNVQASDNSPGVTVACVPPNGGRFDVGTTAVRCVATDAAGNTNQCSFNVSVRPDPPVIQCPGNLIVECALPTGRAVSFTASASSACDSAVAVACAPPSGSVFPIGPTAVTCTATDRAGNRSSCSFSVFLVSSSTNCLGDYSLLKETCLAGEVRADPLLQPYPCGTCVEVTGVPAAGWTFLGWLGDARGSAQTVQFTMSQNKCVEAVFGTPISIRAAANGLAWLDPVAPLYPCGTQARALARPNAGFYFSHWTNSVSDSANPLDFTVAQTNAILAPVFLPLPAGQSALTVETRGNGGVRGRIGPAANRYPVSSNVVLRAIPDEGQQFTGWILDGAGSPALVATNQITLSMEASRYVVAQFTGRPRIEIVRCQGELVQGLFRFKVHGRVLETIVIEMTPTLSDPAAWREVGRATNVLGSIQYEDPYLPNVAQRFYRARVAGAECAAAPSLTLTRQVGSLRLEWPAGVCACVVQQASSLNGSIGWTTIPGSPQVVGDLLRLTVPTSGESRFFRLMCLP